MAAYENFAEAKVPTAEMTITIDKPNGVVENDLMIAFISQGSAGENRTMTPPGGWSTLYTGDYYGGCQFSCFYKVAGDSEPSDYTFTHDTYQMKAYGFIIRVSGVNVADPINIQGMQYDTTTTPGCPDVTTTEDKCLILRLFAADMHYITEDSGYPTAHTGITVDESGSTIGDCCGGAAWIEQETAGATGEAAFTMTEEEQWLAVTIAIESYVVPPKLLAGTAAIQSTTSGVIKCTRGIAGTAAIASTTSGSLTKLTLKLLAGTAAIQSTAIGAVAVEMDLAGTAVITCTAVALIIVFKGFAGTAVIQCTAQGVTKVVRKLAGTASNQCANSGVIKLTQKLIGTVEITCTTSGNLTWLGVKTLAGTSVIQCAAIGALTRTGIRELIGTAAIHCTAIGILTTPGEKLLAGTSIIKSSATGILVVYYGYRLLPPFMEKDVIDPYSGGAWLWLVQIVVPTQTTQRIARNTEDIRYGGKDFLKGNFDVGRIPLTGDGSIPRIQLRVAQDGTGVLEDIVNATKGGADGTVKLIRTCEKFLEQPSAALEAEYDVLTAGSDPQWITFRLGIPNPLTQRFPLWLYSSKVCPLATPSLFKGPRCQYAGEDVVCTGLLEDCYAKGNAVHWGAEIGLDPNAVRV